MRAGADADGRDLQPLGDSAGQLSRDSLQHQREHPGVLEGLGVDQQLLAGAAAALHPEAAQRVDTLGSQPEVPHDRDAGRHHGLHLRHDRAATLQLDRLGAALLQVADSGRQGSLG